MWGPESYNVGQGTRPGNDCYIATKHGPQKSVDLPITKMVIFHSYVSLPEGKPHGYHEPIVSKLRKIMVHYIDLQMIIGILKELNSITQLDTTDLWKTTIAIMNYPLVILQLAMEAMAHVQMKELNSITQLDTTDLWKIAVTIMNYPLVILHLAMAAMAHVQMKQR